MTQRLKFPASLARQINTYAHIFRYAIKADTDSSRTKPLFITISAATSLPGQMLQAK